MTATPPATAALCRYCRLPSDTSADSCPHCGAPVHIEDRVSASGWEEQPAVRDMARIRFGRSTCQVEGTYVPTADLGLAEGDSVYFSHHVLLWVEPSVTMEPLPMRGGWNRVLAGMPLVMMQAHGPGHVALSQDSPGETVVIPLQPGQRVDVREHRFLVATDNVGYDWFQPDIWFTTRSGDETETHYPMGMYLDRFGADSSPGLLLLHAPGNVFVRDLVPNQTICIQPTALLYKDPSVGMQLHFEYPNTRGISWGPQYSNRTAWLRMWGPGRVAVQSVYERPESSGYIQNHSPATMTQW
jgi:uncharacterized protein (AIM24 family)